MYNFFLKYFYSWYTLPLILLHESCHIAVGYILGFKVIKKMLVKVKNPPIYNSHVIFEYNKSRWKWIMVLYSPLLLTLPIILFFLHPILLYIAIYFVSTIMIYKKYVICIFIPSIADRNYLKKIEYHKYVVENASEKEFNYYLKYKKIKDLVEEKHMFSETEFFLAKNLLNNQKN